MPTDLREFFDRQMALIEAGDVDGLLARYHEDAVLLRTNVVVRGRAAIRELFTRYLDPPPRIVSVDGFNAADDSIVYHATLAGPQGERRDYGVLVLRDGKIWRQFAGALA